MISDLFLNDVKQLILIVDSLVGDPSIASFLGLSDQLEIHKETDICGAVECTDGGLPQSDGCSAALRRFWASCR
jgi:hypothetical protein